MELLIKLVCVLCVATSVFADVSHILDHHSSTTTSTPPPPPHPYIFSYSAGRAPGHVDRTHSEVSDGSGTVRGSFSYVDPKNEIRTVQYVADEYGFHPQLSHEPQDTEANLRAAAKHFDLYSKIAEAHAHPDANFVPAIEPEDSEAVARAKNKHYSLFNRIAQEHARIGAEREAQRLAFEATSEPNELEEEHHKH